MFAYLLKVCEKSSEHRFSSEIVSFLKPCKTDSAVFVGLLSTAAPVADKTDKKHDFGKIVVLDVYEAHY